MSLSHKKTRPDRTVFFSDNQMPLHYSLHIVNTCTSIQPFDFYHQTSSQDIWNTNLDVCDGDTCTFKIHDGFWVTFMFMETKFYFNS